MMFGNIQKHHKEVKYIYSVEYIYSLEVYEIRGKDRYCALFL